MYNEKNIYNDFGFARLGFLKYLLKHSKRSCLN